MEKNQLQRIVQEVLENPKLSDDDERIVTRYVRRAVLQIQAHCNRDGLPEALEAVAAQIVEDMLSADGYIQSNKDVASIGRGDTSITYKDQASTYQNTVEFMKNYECQLVHFKKIKLPTDPKDGRD